MASTFTRINSGVVYLSGAITDPTQAVSKQWVETQLVALGAGHAPVTIGITAQSVILSLSGQQLTGQVNLLSSGFVTGQGQLAQTAEGRLYGMLGTSSYVAAAGNHTHAAASETVAGFMSAADKAKLNTVAANATAIALAGSGAAGTASHSDHTHADVTSLASGFMTPAMLAALEGAISGGAGVDSSLSLTGNRVWELAGFNLTVTNEGGGVLTLPEFTRVPGEFDTALLYIMAGGRADFSQAVALNFPTGIIPESALGGAVKRYAHVMTRSNITLSGEQTIDGVVTSNSVVFCQFQASAANRGLWISGTGAWTRPDWFASGSTTQCPYGTVISVLGGAVYGGSSWFMSITAPVTIGTTGTAWTRIANLVAADIGGTVQAHSAALDVLAATPLSGTGNIAMTGYVISTAAAAIAASALSYLPAITGLSGGGASKLASIVTAGATGPLCVLVNIPGQPRMWERVAGTDATGSGIQRPDDYNAGTNAVVWVSI